MGLRLERCVEVNWIKNKKSVLRKKKENMAEVANQKIISCVQETGRRPVWLDKKTGRS